MKAKGLFAWLSAAAIGCSAGCQSTATSLPPVAPIKQSPAARAAAAPHVSHSGAADHADARVETEYRAAAARWVEGDAKACRSILVGLLKRAPDHRDANLLYAELCLLEENPAAGLAAAQRVCRRDPSDAQAQHLRGLLLDTLGRRGEAVQAYQLAVQQAPRDEIYVASLEAATSRPTLDSLFHAVVSGDRAEDKLRLPSPRSAGPRPLEGDVHLAALEEDEDRAGGSATISDGED